MDSFEVNFNMREGDTFNMERAASLVCGDEEGDENKMLPLHY